MTSRGYSVDDPGVLLTAFTADAADDAEATVDGDAIVSARWFTREQIEALPEAEIQPPASLARVLVDRFL